MSKPPATLALWTTRPFSHGRRRENPCGGSSPHGRRKPERRQPMAVAVLSSTQQRLMPTSPYRARKLLRAGKAEIFSHQPFTIRLTKRADGEVQPVELCMDTGYQYIGISVKSDKHEFFAKENEIYQLLRDEGYTDEEISRSCQRTFRQDVGRKTGIWFCRGNSGRSYGRVSGRRNLKNRYICTYICDNFSYNHWEIVIL